MKMKHLEEYLACPFLLCHRVSMKTSQYSKYQKDVFL